MVLNAIDDDPCLAESTKRQYLKAVVSYVMRQASLAELGQLVAYAQAVGASTRAFLAAASGRPSSQIAHEAKGGVTPENVLEV
jgi:hypothetical protein